MVPLIDMANHKENSTHHVRQGLEGFELVAGEAIRSGEEIHISYGSHRNDATAMHYGFLLPDQPPALFSTDARLAMKGLDTKDQVIAARAELRALLDSLPSSVEDDLHRVQQMEASANESATSTAFESGDLLVTYTNIARKQAMLHEISLMDASLNAHDEL